MKIDAAVIGSGVVGAAVAMELARAGRSVWVLEKKERAGGETTERNSGVIHAGLHYPPDSWKTKLCVEGNGLLYAWAAARGVPHRRCGKLIVAASDAELGALEAVRAHGASVGVSELSIVGRDALPDGVRGAGALLSPSTGIVDAVALTASLLDDARAHGASVLTRCEVRGLAPGWRLDTSRGEVSADVVVNAAGLYADDVARMAGVEGYRIHPCRGDYYRLRTARRFDRLVYPVRQSGAPGLGVHLTIDLAGGVRLGPHTAWIEARDDYRDPPVDARAAFAAAAARILEGVSAEDLTYDSCGIRPKLRAASDPAERDFVIARDRPGLVNLVGIESPGLTSALALARAVRQLL